MSNDPTPDQTLPVRAIRPDRHVLVLEGGDGDEFEGNGADNVQCRAFDDGQNYAALERGTA